MDFLNKGMGRMMYKVETGKISTKGQVVIPANIRDMLQIGEGDRLEFSQEGDKVIVKGIKKKTILDAIGIIKVDKKFMEVNEIREQVRKDAVSNDLARQLREG